MQQQKYIVVGARGLHFFLLSENPKVSRLAAQNHYSINKDIKYSNCNCCAMCNMVVQVGSKFSVEMYRIERIFASK